MDPMDTKTYFDFRAVARAVHALGCAFASNAGITNDSKFEPHAELVAALREIEHRDLAGYRYFTEQQLPPEPEQPASEALKAVTCKMCGSEEADVRWIPDLSGERVMFVTCSRCGNNWNLASLDKQQPASDNNKGVI